MKQKASALIEKGVCKMDSKSQFDTVEPLYDARIRGTLFISTASGERVHMHGGCWAAPCSYDPPRFMVAVPKEFEGAQIIQEGGVFAASIVAVDQTKFNQAYFSGRHLISELGRENFLRAPSGSPVLAESLAYIDAHVHESWDLGDFLLVVGDVTDAAELHPKKRNLTVNEIVKAGDPRGEREVHLPYEGQNFDTRQLQAAPVGPSSIDGRWFTHIYSYREWGLLFVSVAKGENVLRSFVTERLIQVSHDPPRFAVMFGKQAHKGGNPVLAPGATVTMSLLSQDQLPLAQALHEAEMRPNTNAAHHSKMTTEQGGEDEMARNENEYGTNKVPGWGYRATGAIAHFQGNIESLHTIGDEQMAIVPIERTEWEHKEKRNLTVSDLFPRRLLGSVE